MLTVWCTICVQYALGLSRIPSRHTHSTILGLTSHLSLHVITVALIAENGAETGVRMYGGELVGVPATSFRTYPLSPYRYRTAPPPVAIYGTLRHFSALRTYYHYGNSSPFELVLVNLPRVTSWYQFKSGNAPLCIAERRLPGATGATIAEPEAE